MVQEIDDDTKTLGFPNLRCSTESNQIHNNDASNWLHQDADRYSFNQTILCSTNESIDHWNAIAQERNINHPFELLSQDTFEEVGDPHGHIKKMLSTYVLNNFWKNGVPNCKLILKIGDICLATRGINCLDLANNS